MSLEEQPLTRRLYEALVTLEGDRASRYIPGPIRRFVDAKYGYGNQHIQMFLGQLLYWASPVKSLTEKNSFEDVVRMKVRKRGFMWVAKTREEWQSECSMTEYQVKQTIRKLTEDGIIHKIAGFYGGRRITHIRWNLEALERILIGTPKRKSDTTHKVWESVSESEKSASTPTPNRNRKQVRRVKCHNGTLPEFEREEALFEAANPSFVPDSQTANSTTPSDGEFDHSITETSVQRSSPSLRSGVKKEIMARLRLVLEDGAFLFGANNPRHPVGRCVETALKKLVAEDHITPELIDLLIDLKGHGVILPLNTWVDLTLDFSKSKEDINTTLRYALEDSDIPRKLKNRILQHDLNYA